MHASVTILPLAELLQTDAAGSRNCVEEALKGFVCEYKGSVVSDVVDFIATKAIPFEENKICRTFLAVDEGDLGQGVLTVLGYFTLQYIQSRVNDESLEALGEDLRGIVSANYDSTSGVLLAQLARDSRYTPEDLDGGVLLAYAERQARLVCDYVGGELVYIDCDEELRRYYSEKGYVEIECVDDGSGERYYKMQKRLYPKLSPVLEALIHDASE